MLAQMPTTIPFDVTSDDVEKGRRWNPTECPVACAIKRALDSLPRPYDYVEVAGVVMIGLGHEHWKYAMPEALQQEIHRYDETGHAITPGTHELVLIRKLANHDRD